jgi:hypothetical protein
LRNTNTFFKEKKCAHTNTHSYFKSGFKKILRRMGQNFSLQICDNPEMSQKLFFVNLHRTLLPGDSNRSQDRQTTSSLLALSHHGLSLRRLVLGQKLRQRCPIVQVSVFCRCSISKNHLQLLNQQQLVYQL